MGTISPSFGALGFLNSFIAEVESGPNGGWKYLGGSAAPLQSVSVIIWLNAALKNPQDPFYQHHDGTNGRCEIEEYAGIVLGHERAHVDLFRARLERALIGPFLDDQRGRVSIEDFEERIGRVEGFTLEDLMTLPSGEEQRIGTVVPGCDIDFRTPYRRRGGRK